ncbi:MAG: hypothetical protein H6Q00_1605 [Holophagaceae bacterium]|nr:hypothetical protein [Holophagaceae bacterium]
MGRHSSRSPLVIEPGAMEKLEAIAFSEDESQARREKARVLIAYSKGLRISILERILQINRPRIGRILELAEELGPLEAMEEQRGRWKRQNRLLQEETI